MLRQLIQTIILPLDRAQQLELASLEKRSIERQKKILQLAISVNELAVAFKRLNVLILDQGTAMDRIENNVVKALDDIHNGTETLAYTDDNYGKGLATKCIFCLIIAILIFIAILTVKVSVK